MPCFKIILIIILICPSAYSQRLNDNDIDFVHQIYPSLVKGGCSTIECHGSPQNKLRLSIFSGFPEKDYQALVKEKGGRYINFIEPEKSLLIRKLSESIKHHGGSYKNKPELLLSLIQWIQNGAPYNENPGLKIEKLQLSLLSADLKPGEQHMLKVMAIYTDNTEKDVTRFCYIESQNPEIISIENNQSFRVNIYGKASVFARYLHHFGVETYNIRQTLPTNIKINNGKTDIDRLVNKELKALGIPPSEIASDEEFLRRVYLCLTGKLPKAQEVKQFLNDTDESKRALLISRLINTTDFADFLSLKWGDLLRCKSEYPSNLWPNAVQAYQHWIKSALNENMPYDQFVRKLLVSSGSNFRQAEVNFYRAFQKRSPQLIAESTALIFMGNRLECARCHAHPKSQCRITEATGLHTFFTQLKYKKTGEWKEEIVYIDKDKSVSPNKIKMPDNRLVKLNKGQDHRAIFADWLTSPENPFFATTMVNRIWYWLMGRGIVHEPDDFRETNPPSNPELLAYLEKEFVDNGYNIKHIFSLILNSETFQRSAKTNKWNETDHSMFSHYPLRRLDAEQLIDAICDITGVPDNYMSRVPEPFTFLPDDYRAIHLADGTISTPFLEMFGRPSRDNSYEGNRNNELNMKQVLYLLNSSHLHEKIEESPNIKKLIDRWDNDKVLIKQIYLTILSRFPDKNELEISISYLQNNSRSKRENVNNLVWALLNTKEFIFNH